MKCRPICSFCGVTSRRHDFVIISPVYKEWVEKTHTGFFAEHISWRQDFSTGEWDFPLLNQSPVTKTDYIPSIKSDEMPQLWMFYDVSEMRCSVSSVGSSSRAGVTPRREEEWARVFPSFSHIQIDQQRSKVWLGLWIKSCTCSRRIIKLCTISKQDICFIF